MKRKPLSLRWHGGWIGERPGGRDLAGGLVPRHYRP